MSIWDVLAENKKAHRNYSSSPSPDKPYDIRAMSDEEKTALGNAQRKGCQELAAHLKKIKEKKESIYVEFEEVKVPRLEDKKA
jgi:hypothetical protein